ncbi:MAG: substrate-binding domain-containing protein [Alphaproteobacteria bacterium]|nr:substrate-binding domain-containing protein [Alphaproteobacteria bacterium]
MSVAAAALAMALASAHPSLACASGLPHAARTATGTAVAPPSGAAWLTADGAVRIVGYNDMAGMIARWDAGFTALHPQVRFAPVLKSTRSAPPALVAGTSALAPMGAEFTPQDLAAYRRAFGGAPLMIRVAHDSLDPKALSGPIGIIVPTVNPLRSLDLAQVARIFAAGRTPRTWGELGLTGSWRTRPVHLLGLRPGTALARFLQARAFAGRPYSPAVQGFGHSTDVARAVARDPYAIGFAGLDTPMTGLRAVPLAAAPGERAIAPTRSALQEGLYPLDRQLLIYAQRPLDPLVRAYLAFVLSCEGQAAVAADPLGYIPLTPAQAGAERARLRPKTSRHSGPRTGPRSR